MENKINTGIPIWSEYVSKTIQPSYSESTYSNKIIFKDNNTKNNKSTNNKSTIIEEIEDLEITDYPYIGIGKKPLSKKLISDNKIERIIGG